MTGPMPCKRTTSRSVSGLRGRWQNKRQRPPRRRKIPNPTPFSARFIPRRGLGKKLLLGLPFGIRITPHSTSPPTPGRIHDDNISIFCTNISSGSHRMVMPLDLLISITTIFSPRLEGVERRRQEAMTGRLRSSSSCPGVGGKPSRTFGTASSTLVRFRPAGATPWLPSWTNPREERGRSVSPPFAGELAHPPW